MSRSKVPRDLRPEVRFRLAGLVGALVVRIWGATLRAEWVDIHGNRTRGRVEGPRVYAFWHAGILPLTYLYRGLGAVVLVSRHDDGEYISQVVCRLGFGVIRGSTTRGGLRALMEMARAGRDGHQLAVTPDGPRGPRHVLQNGVLHIAQRSGQPIHPLAVEAVRRTELNSWDRFQIPHPSSRVVVVSGDPILIPEGATSEELDAVWAPRVAAALEECNDRARLWREERLGGR